MVNCLFGYTIDHFLDFLKPSPNDSLLRAVSEKNIVRMKSLIKSNATVRYPRHKGKTVFHVCCEKGNSEMLREMVNAVDKDTNLVIYDNDGYTPLQLACINGHVECVKILLESKLNVQDENYICIERELITNAERFDNEELNEFSVEKIPKERMKYWSPLLISCTLDHASIVELLVDHMKSELDGEIDIFCLCLAAFYGSYNTVVYYTKKREVNPNCKLIEKYIHSTPLFYACLSGSERVIMYLFTNQAEIPSSKKVLTSCVPLLVLILTRCNSEVIVKFFSSMYSTFISGDVLKQLYIVSSVHCRALFDLIGKNQNVSINAVDPKLDMNVLHFCAKHGNVEMIKHSVSLGASVNEKNSQNRFDDF